MISMTPISMIRTSGPASFQPQSTSSHARFSGGGDPFAAARKRATETMKQPTKTSEELEREN